MMKSGPKKNLTFCKKSALTLSFPQPPPFFCKFSNPQFLAQFNQVPLMPINQFLSSQTEAGHSQHTHIPCHSYIVSQIKLIVHFLDNLLPRQVERPDLVGKQGGVVNGPYDNDASNFSTPEANGTIYLGVCGHTSMRQGSFVLRNLAHWHTEVRTGMESPLSAPTRPMLLGKMSPAA